MYTTRFNKHVVKGWLKSKYTIGLCIIMVVLLFGWIKNADSHDSIESQKQLILQEVCPIGTHTDCGIRYLEIYKSIIDLYLSKGGNFSKTHERAIEAMKEVRGLCK